MPEGKLKKGRHGIVGKIRYAIGVGPDEDVTVVTPQFDREPGYPSPASPPADRAAFDALATLDWRALKELGLRPWDEIEDGKALWLFPAEWYASIPDGLPIVSISGRHEVFSRGETDNDTRFGMLAYGIVGQAKPRTPHPTNEKKEHGT